MERMVVVTLVKDNTFSSFFHLRLSHILLQSILHIYPRFCTFVAVDCTHYHIFCNFLSDPTLFQYPLCTFCNHFYKIGQS